MTDSVVQDFFISRFEEIGSPLLTFKTEEYTINGKKERRKVATNVLYPNKSFTRPDNCYWFELFFLANAPFQQELGRTGRNRWRGIFQINICSPKDAGTRAINNRFDRITKQFGRGYITNGLRITSIARDTPHSYDDYYVQPVSIYYEADLDTD